MRVIVGSPHPDVLPLVDKKVKQYDIAVAIHNHGPGDKLYPTPKSVYDRVKDLDPRIGLCMDIGHTLRIGADPVADAKLYADRLLDVHVKDVSEASAKGETLEIGRGVIDIPAFLRTLVETNYSRDRLVRVREGRRRPDAGPVRIGRLRQGRSGDAVGSFGSAEKSFFHSVTQ